MAQRVAILGLGTMGIGMAKNLLKAGFSVAAYNRTRAKAEPLVGEGAIIADKLLVRIASEGQLRDGYTKDYFTGKEYDNRDDLSWRVGVTLRPTDDIENYFIYDGYYQDTNGSSTIARYVKPKQALAAIPIPGVGTFPLTLGSGPSYLGLFGPNAAATAYAGILAGGFSFYPNIAQAVAEAVERGLFRPVEAQRTAEALWAGLHGALSLHITCPVMMPEVRAVATIVQESMLAGLRA